MRFLPRRTLVVPGPRAAVAALSVALLFVGAPRRASMGQTFVPTSVHFALQPPMCIDVSDDPTTVVRQTFALADVDNDKNPDLIVADQINDTVDVYLGDGKGSFSDGQGNSAPWVSVSVPDAPIAVAVADLGSDFASPAAGKPDGHPDIIVGSDGGDVVILFGDGTSDAGSNFQSQLDISDTVSTGGGVVGFALADFNGDGHTDIAVADDFGAVELVCYGSGTFDVCDANNADGIDTVDSNPIDIVAGDFNGDGLIDVAVLNQDPNTLSSVTPIYATMPPGTFDGMNVNPIKTVGEANSAGGFATTFGVKATIDNLTINADMIDDIAVVNNGDNGNNFGVTLLGLGNSGFRANCEPTFNMSFYSTGAALGDFDGDGALDLLSTVNPPNSQDALNINPGNGSAACSAQTGNAGFSDEAQAPGGLTGAGIVPLTPGGLAINAADIGGPDALPEFVILQPQGSALGLCANQMSIRVGINDTKNQPTPTPFTPGPTFTATPTTTGSQLPTDTPTPIPPSATPKPTSTPTPIPTANYGRCDMTVTGAAALSGIATGLLDGDATQDIAVIDPTNKAVYVLFNTSTFKSQLHNCAVTPTEAASPTAVDTSVPTPTPTATSSTPTIAPTPISPASPPVVISLGQSPTAIVAVNVDCGTNDSNIDLVVAESDGIVVLHGDGKGGFTKDLPIAVGTNPVAIAADYPDPQNPAMRKPLDLDGDGCTDLVVANAGSSFLSILHGVRGGGFSAPETLGLRGSATTVGAGDFDNDGKVDLVAGLSSGVAVLLPSASSVNARNISSGDPIVSIRSGFFDSDLIPDLLITRTSESDIFLSTGASFKTSTGSSLSGWPPPSGSSSGATDAGVGAFNTTDSNTDAVVSSYRDSALYFGMTDGAGAFLTPSIKAFPVGQHPMALAVAPIDSDSKADVVTANQDGTITVLLSTAPPPTPTPAPTNTVTPPGPTLTPTPELTNTPTITNTPGPSPTATNTRGGFGLNGSCSVADTQTRPSYEAAALLAILLAMRGFRSRRARIGALVALVVAGSLGRAGIASGQSATPTVTPTPQVVPTYVRCSLSAGQLGDSGQFIAGVAADFNHDGEKDLALVDKKNGQVVVALTNEAGFAAGSCGQGFPTPTTFSVVSDPEGIAAGHFTTSQDSDLAILQFAPQPVAGVWTNQGSGTFSAGATTTRLNQPVPDAVAVGFVNQDQIADLVVGDGNTIVVYFGPPGAPTPAATPTGGNVYTPSTTLSLGSAQLFALRLADFDGDSRLDIAAVDIFSNVIVFLQTSPGTFTAQPSFPISGTANVVAMEVADPNRSPMCAPHCDFDRNGVPDLAFLMSDGTVHVFLGESAAAGSVTFHEQMVGPLTGSHVPKALGLSDLNGDGNLDAVVTDDGSEVLLVLGDGTGNLIPWTGNPRLRSTGEPDVVLLANVDGDQLDDIITANGDGSMTVFLSSDPPHTPTPTKTATSPPTNTPGPTDSPTVPTPTATFTGTVTPTVTQTTTPGQFQVMGTGCADVGGGGGLAGAMPLLILAGLVGLRRRSRA